MLWVDASAPPGGDGSASRPLKLLPAHVGPELEVHARTGLYRGPFRLERARLVGHGAVVLFSEEPGATVASAEDSRIAGVSLQGGAVGLEARGVVELEGVHFSGHRTAGLRAHPSSMVLGRGLQLEAPAGRATAVEASAAHVQLTALRVRSAWHRGLSAMEAEIILEDASFEGPATAVHGVGGRVRVERFASSGGTGPAIFVSRCRLSLRHAQVRGHEYGLQTGAGTKVDVEGLEVEGTQEAAVALSGTSGILRGLELRGSGSAGALQLLGAASASGLTDGGAGDEAPTVLVERSRVRDVPALGVLVRQCRTVLRDVTVEGVRQEVDGTLGPSLGDAFHLRDAWVDADGLSVRDAEGAAVWASAGARVTLGRLTSVRTGVGALVVERYARVDARAVTSEASRGPAVSVLEHGTLRIRELASKGSDAPPLWVDCDRGGAARVLHVIADREWPLDRCVEREAPEGLDGGPAPQAPEGVAPRQRRE